MKFKKQDPRSYKRLICSVAWDEKTIQKSADGALTVIGYANTKGKDRVGDVVLPEAFTKTLPTYMDNPVLLYMHDWDKVAGKVIHAEIDEKGLKVKARISGASDCQDVRTKINEGILSTFSIGYNEIDADWEKETATNVVKEVELLEISIVSIPCNTEAKFEPVQEAKEDEQVDAPKSAPSQAALEDGNVFLVDDGLRDYFIEKINSAHNEGKSVTKSLMKEWEMEICSEKKITPVEQKTIENQILTLLKKDSEMNKKELEALIKKLRGEKVSTKDVEAEVVEEIEEPAAKMEGEEEEEEEDDKDEKMDGDEGENAMAMMMERLDALSEGMASLLEMIAMMGAEDKMDHEEEEEESSEDEEEEEKVEMEMSEEDEEEDEEKELSDEEGIELLEELSEQLDM